MIKSRMRKKPHAELAKEFFMHIKMPIIIILRNVIRSQLVIDMLQQNPLYLEISKKTSITKMKFSIKKVYKLLFIT